MTEPNRPYLGPKQDDGTFPIVNPIMRGATPDWKATAHYFGNRMVEEQSARFDSTIRLSGARAVLRYISKRWWFRWFAPLATKAYATEVVEPKAY